MTLDLSELALYAGALAVLFLTPGPVWAALVARAVSGGYASAWPLALGVAVGDALWPLAAIFGVSALIALYADFLIWLRYAGALMLALIGLQIIRHARMIPGKDRALTRPGWRAGFLAGLMVILGNPKAILFYMGLLPGFFDMGNLTLLDIVAICVLSFAVPLSGNLVLAGLVGRAQRFLSSPNAVFRTNLVSGGLLVLVALGIALT
ncbi:LysE family translocator [Abyssibius alkaniclasticus]|uniref:LysE family translocator n=1 Tax=Abyssibius alkaniclasticus TaxID=2881234 RepID=UPI0023637E65|nr:LysE family translocator [Abyssibius alkaniclasticus]UPH71982.1 LysE family translocator [Abyssibius alkaniclasticus]|tara:strand:+ start:331 stop:951 length:621 start_codon:yes stop_codon:yes gene_type:complete